MRAFGLIPLALAAALLCFVQKPDVLAADFGDLFAVRSAEGKLLFSSDRRGKFVRNEWLQLEGANDDYDVWPGEGQAGGLLTCDASSCEYKTKGQSVSFVLAPEGLAAACTKSALVFSHLDLGGETCAAPLKDKWKLYHSGAEAVYMKPDGLHVVSVMDERGVRPWTLPKRPSWQD
jgi:competence protein ComEC